MTVDAPPPCAETPGGVASSSGPSSGGESVRSDAADVDAESLPDAPSVAGSDESASKLDVRIELAYIMRKYFLPNTAITEIIRLFKSKKWAMSDLEFWDTYRDLEEFEKEFVPGDEAWEAVDLELEEMIPLFPSLPSDMSAEQKTAVMQKMLRIVLDPIMDVSTLERHCKVIVGETPGGILRLPNIITYFRTLAHYAAWEHRAMMQIVPLLVHLPGREDVGAAMVMFNEWYRAYFRVEFHTEESLEQSISRTEE
ncbi:unnamed protein product [Closterium sp. NIES-64]|nr:unnamed protein product [Closterium sp. NIES-64]